MLKTIAYKRLVARAASKSSRRKRTAPPVTTRRVRHFCIFTRCTLGDLPVELIVMILQYLTVQEIVRFQYISRYFRSLIQNARPLQYRIQCYLADVLEEPLHRERSRIAQLKAIRAWRKAWSTMKWREETSIAYDDDFMAYDLYNSWLPSQLRGMKRRPMGLIDVGCNYTFSLDDAVVLLEKPIFEDGSRWVEYHVVEAERERRHCGRRANAKRMLIQLPADLEDEYDRSFRIWGDHVLVEETCYSGETDDTLLHVWLFEWRTGIPKLHFWIRDPHDVDEGKSDRVAWLDDNLLLVTFFPAVGEAAIAVFDCRKTPRLRGPFNHNFVRHAVLVLALPELSDRATYDYIQIFCQPRRQALPARYRRAAFTPANSWPLILVPLDILCHSSFITYELLIPSGVVMSRLEAAASFQQRYHKPKRVQWGDWGSETRLVQNGHGSVHGPRYVKTERNSTTGKKTVVVWDFRPPDLLLHDLCTEDGEVEIVTKPTRVQNKKVFGQPIVTQAPYRRIDTGIVVEEGPSLPDTDHDESDSEPETTVEDCESPFMGDNGLVLVPMPHAPDPKQMRMFTF